MTFSLFTCWMSLLALHSLCSVLGRGRCFQREAPTQWGLLSYSKSPSQEKPGRFIFLKTWFLKWEDFVSHHNSSYWLCSLHPSLMHQLRRRWKMKTENPIQTGSNNNKYIHSCVWMPVRIQVRFDSAVQTMPLKSSPLFCYNIGAALRLSTTCLQPTWSHTLHPMTIATVYLTYSHSTA